MHLSKSRKDFARDNKRYGWMRLYDDFVGHPKWRRVAVRAEVPLGFVHTIVIALFCAASKARSRGWIGNFDFEEVEAATDIPATNIAAVFRVLVDIGWINQDHIADWLDRQPEGEDPTAALRQRNKRNKDKARRAYSAGTATPDQVELLSVAEREELARLAQASRVTASPPASQATEHIRPFMAERTDDGSQEGKSLVKLRNDLAAREWLLGKPQANTLAVVYGPGSKIVSDNFGCNRLNADGTIRRWLAEQMNGDATALATIISAAFEQAITNEAFRNVVESRITEYARERIAGPSLPFGVTAIKGGRP